MVGTAQWDSGLLSQEEEETPVQASRHSVACRMALRCFVPHNLGLQGKRIPGIEPAVVHNCNWARGDEPVGVHNCSQACGAEVAHRVTGPQKELGLAPGCCTGVLVAGTEEQAVPTSLAH